MLNLLHKNTLTRNIIKKVFLMINVCFTLISIQVFSQDFDDEALLITVEVPFVELHSGPGIGYPVINIVEQGNKIKVLFKRTSWLKVEDKQGNSAWLQQSALNQVSQAGENIEITELDVDNYQQRNWEAGFMYGDLNGASFYNVSLAYLFSDVISTELSIGKSQGDISDNNIYQLRLLGQPFPNWIVSPYVGIGIGLIETTPHSVLADAVKRENTLMSGALGVQYYVARNFLLRAEYQYSLVLTDRDDNEEIKLWQLGFSVFF